ncbi:NAD(P)H-hydrate dehydratase [Antarcticirhabdus aurantiaca]|uniref:NAD(P)H-hydrate dehydratase n=1 Tax=Antarcticirhabdus aurantiaca TaxID=2606717 RepID=A0ACD4NVJ2_9HYPH|nr:NAD(P)H-hydrate dehydratase [Antarcticirhabdus aurantiaca]WAJ31015.1 NAD(P)H-hydrate dehydratase [Jeongeuplla avenae]
MSRSDPASPLQAALPTCAETRRLDALTMQAGLAGGILMERAGAFVAATALRLFPTASRVAILAGAGNNGGDAYVAARYLAAAGRDVVVFELAEASRLSGDAAAASAGYAGPRLPLTQVRPEDFGLVVDGLFGAGLSRPIDGVAAEAIRRVNAAGTPILAIDLPSGIDGDTGAALGIAIEAQATATFFRRKPGHLLMPGRAHCGQVFVGDIGIADATLASLDPATFANEPALFLAALRLPTLAGHKYDRGHAVVLSGSASKTGAARLSAGAALRAGAGLVTVLSPASAVLVNAAHLTAVMLRRCDDEAELDAVLADERLNAFVLGPGFGVGERARHYAGRLLAADRHVVLDADALTSFADIPDDLFSMIRGSKGSAVLTPHAGEFKRLFPDLAETSDGKLSRAREAAARSGAVVILKGADTVIAAPDGRAAINATGTPWLATAGSGDVLSGIVCAQLAQGTPGFEAACAGVWMHGKAAEAFGPGLIAEDLAPMLPKVLAELTADRG